MLGHLIRKEVLDHISSFRFLIHPLPQTRPAPETFAPHSTSYILSCSISEGAWMIRRIVQKELLSHLLALCVLFFVCAYFSFLRYDVR